MQLLATSPLIRVLPSFPWRDRRVASEGEGSAITAVGSEADMQAAPEIDGRSRAKGAASPTPVGAKNNDLRTPGGLRVDTVLGEPRDPIALERATHDLAVFRERHEPPDRVVGVD